MIEVEENGGGKRPVWNVIIIVMNYKRGKKTLTFGPIAISNHKYADFCFNK